jgi:hypothetical protein
MTTTVRFSSWTIDEGVYPQMRKGDVIRVALEVEPVGVLEPTTQAGQCVTSGDAHCSFVASVLAIFVEAGERPLAALDAGGIRFYVEREEVAGLQVGDAVSGRGLLSIDDYMWTEFFAGSDKAPELFNVVQIDTIRMIDPAGRTIELTETPSRSTAGHVVFIDLVQTPSAAATSVPVTFLRSSADDPDRG